MFINQGQQVLQSEAAECGLACIATVLSHYGDRTSLADLRRSHSISLKGATLKSLMAMAAGRGLLTRPLKLDMDEVQNLKVPCVLHWNLNHFVVLTKVAKQRLHIVDPAIGRRRVIMSEASRSFTGVALELWPGVEFKAKEAKPQVSLRQLAGRIFGFKRALVQILILSMALQIFSLLSPLISQGIMDHVLVNNDTDLLKVLVVASVLLLLIQTCTSLARSWASIYLSTHLGIQWMGNVLAHLLRLPANFFEKRHLGDITSRLGSVTAIQNMLTSSVIGVLLDGLMAVTTLIMMMKYSMTLFFISLGALSCYLLVRLATFEWFREASEEQMIRSAKQQSHLLETLRGISSIKVSGHENQRHSIWMNLAVDSQNQAVRIALMGMGYGTLNGLVFGAEGIAVLGIGANLVIDHVFSIGMLVAYMAYKAQFSGRISSLIDTFIGFKMLRLHAERLGDIVLTEPEDARTRGHDVRLADSSIVVEGLGFQYADDEPWVLKECSFRIGAGEAVAIVGPSGCGKTTLLKLLLGLLKPSEGTIRIGGVDIHEAGPGNVRRAIGTVMQDDQLFAGSVADNIAFFESDVDRERIERAAKLASVHDEIAAMPMGYYGLIGDMGSSLSGGQKQRLLLARALCRDPQLLFLDEATSHLDIAKERSVNLAVGGLQLTKVIVAHRPETIASADRVLLLADGKLLA